MAKSEVGHARTQRRMPRKRPAARPLLHSVSPVNDGVFPIVSDALIGSLDVGIQSSLPRYTNAFKKFLEDNKLLSRVRWYSKEEGEAHNPTWKFIVERKKTESAASMLELITFSGDGQYFAEGEGLTKKEAEDAATRAAARLWLSQSASR